MTKPETGKRLSYKFRLYPNKEQERYFALNFDCCRYVYNYFLRARINAYQVTRPELYDGTPNPDYDPNAKPMTFFETSSALTRLKKETVDEEGRRWLYDADSAALVYTLRHLENAYQNFFRRVKQGATPGFPKFKLSSDSSQSFTVAECRILDKGHVKLPKIGIVRGKFHREVKGKIVSATISKNAAGQYHVSINVKEADIEPLPPLGDQVGIALGVNPLVVTNEGEIFENPRVEKKLSRRLAREKRRLSRKVFGSNNYKKQRAKVARVYLKIVNVRSYGIHNITRQLVNSHGTIITREVSVDQMMQRETLGKKKLPKSARRKINRALADARLPEINRQLAYKSDWAGRVFVLVPEGTLTAQVCSDCGYREETVAKKIKREWTCSQCGRVHSRKYNGAENILQAGLDILAGTEESYVLKATAAERKRKRELEDSSAKE